MDFFSGFLPTTIFHPPKAWVIMGSLRGQMALIDPKPLKERSYYISAWQDSIVLSWPICDQFYAHPITMMRDVYIKGSTVRI